MEIKTPEHIEQMLESLILSRAKRKKLHRHLSNQTRRYFRSQIRKQRDIKDLPFAPRSRRNKVNLDMRRNMFTGLSKMLMAHSDEEGFSVGLAGLAGVIGEVHNEGKTVNFPARINGWFNKNTNQWEGGKKVRMAYKMPQRTIVGWSPKLEQEIAHEIFNAMKTELKK